MNISIGTRLVTIALTGCAVAALATPAWASSDGITPHRDGSKAVAFVADVRGDDGASSTHNALRRDGSKAVPFAASVGPNASASGVSGWELAAIVGGSALGLAMLGIGATFVVGKRRTRMGSAAPSARSA
jgi:hypothetical protein